MKLMQVLLPESMPLCHSDVNWILRTGVNNIGTTNYPF